MTSFVTSSLVRRVGAKGGIFAASAAAGVVASACWLDRSASPLASCEAEASTTCNEKSTTNTTTRNGEKSTLRKKMTLIGRFSLESETPTNPSIPTFFIALAGTKPFTAQSFQDLWNERGMQDLHPRFHHKVSSTHDGYFEPNHNLDIKDCMPPIIYREDLKYRISTALSSPINVQDALWQVQVSCGPLGSSGAIPKVTADFIKREFPFWKESLLIFRGHHVLADGVSLGAAFGDLTDEAQELKQLVHMEVKRRTGIGKTLLQRLELYFKRLVWFLVGSFQAFMHHFYLLLFTPTSPFEQLQPYLDSTTTTTTRRNVSWCIAAPLDEIKKVAKSFGKNITVNDVVVSCVTFAVQKQLEYHRTKLAAINNNTTKITKRHANINVVIPVHLGGGVLLPNQSIGNFIGAFLCKVPGECEDLTSKERLMQVHASLSQRKSTPAPLLSYLLVRATSMLPTSVTKRLLTTLQAHACVAITNTRGSPRPLHLQGNPIVAIQGFLPLAPKIPIGICVTSYNGTVSLSITAEPWAVPNADEFLANMLQEYQRLLQLSISKTT